MATIDLLVFVVTRGQVFPHVFFSWIILVLWSLLVCIIITDSIRFFQLKTIDHSLQCFLSSSWIGSKPWTIIILKCDTWVLKHWVFKITLSDIATKQVLIILILAFKLGIRIFTRLPKLNITFSNRTTMWTKTKSLFRITFTFFIFNLRTMSTCSFSKFWSHSLILYLLYAMFFLIMNLVSTFLL